VGDDISVGVGVGVAVAVGGGVGVGLAGTVIATLTTPLVRW